MNSETSARLRSTIVKVPDASPGLLFLNGQQKQFTLDGVWKSPVAPAPNMTVDVDLDSVGGISAITVVDSQRLAKERLNQIGGVAQARSKEVVKLAKQGIGALAARMGAVPLGASVLLWIAWFFFPSASADAGSAPISLTFWNLLGLDFNNMESIYKGGGNRGIFAFLGLLAIAAPFVAPFIRAAWSKYLNAAPFVYFVLRFFSILYSESKVFGDLVKMGQPNPFSWNWPVLFFLAIATLVLATGALKKPANT